MKIPFYKQLSYIISATLLWVAPIMFNACDSGADIPEKPELTVSGEEFIVGKDGGQITFDIETNRAWLLLVSGNKIGEKEWCSVTPSPTIAEQGTPGKHKITVTVLPEENENAEARIANLQFAASAAGKTVKIIQSGKPAVTTTEARDVYEKSALIGGKWTYVGKDIEITETGAAWKQSNASGEYTHKVSDNNSTEQGDINVSLTNLSVETKYTYKAYIKDTKGNYYYGAEMEFTTTGLPVSVKISELRALASANLTSSAPTMKIPQNGILKGIVVSELAAGNMEAAQFAIIDGTAQNCGIVVVLPNPAENTFNPGDSLHIRVKDGVLRRVNRNNSYHLELSAGKITKTAENNPVTPVTVVHTDLARYEGMYVTIQNTQLTKNFADFDIWNEGVVYNYDMEVNGSDKTYGLNVLNGANFASDPVIHKSGTIKGIAVISADRTSTEGSTAVLLPRNRNDLAGLTETRFASKLELTFLPPVFSGRLATFNETVATKITIAYVNGDGSTITGTISATVSGEAGKGIEIVPVNNYQLAKGSGAIELIIKGVPQVPGQVVFTITGMDAQLGANNTCTATVALAEPPIGNFEASCSTTGLGNNFGSAYNNIPLRLDGNNPNVTVSNLIPRNFTTGGTGTWSNCWGGVDWSGNTEANKLSNPAKDAQFTVAVSPGKKLSLLQFDIVIRSQNVNTFSLQYKIDGGVFNEIAELQTGTAISKLTDLSTIPALQNLTGNQTVTFRIVPIGGPADGRWAINTSTNGKSMSLVGNVE